MYYFASDTHLIFGGDAEARRVEELFLEWLDMASKDAEAIFLCGDIFDFWFEYQHVVPKGFVRVLAKIANLTQRGIRVVYMVGNHDMWVGNYLSEECGVEIYITPQRFMLGGRMVHVAHGDNLNVVGDWKLTLLNSIFRSKIIRVLFSWLVHPDLAMKFGLRWSNSSRKKHPITPCHNTGVHEATESLIDYAAAQQLLTPCDHYIYGHLHQSLQRSVTDPSQRDYTVTFIGNWGQETTYAKLDREGNMTIERV